METSLLETIGISKDDLQERLIDHLASVVLSGKYFDEEGDEIAMPSELANRLRDVVTKRIDAAIEKIADVHIIPNAVSYIENVTISKTNQYGEKKEPDLTFREYLAKKAEDYLTEQVDYQGKSKSSGDYNWRGNQTRIVYMVQSHLQYEIERVMKAAVAEANSKIAEGITGAVKLQLANIMNGIKCTVAVK